MRNRSLQFRRTDSLQSCDKYIVFGNARTRNPPNHHRGWSQLRGFRKGVGRKDLIWLNAASGFFKHVDMAIFASSGMAA